MAEVLSFRVLARVTAYVTDAMYDHWDDGTFSSYDATEVEVLRPPEHAGRLTLFHAEPAPEDSDWRAVGRIFNFVIDAESLRDGATIFSGAVSEMRETRT